MRSGFPYGYLDACYRIEDWYFPPETHQRAFQHNQGTSSYKASRLKTLLEGEDRTMSGDIRGLGREGTAKRVDASKPIDLPYRLLVFRRSAVGINVK